MVQSVLFENLPYTSKKHTFRNREEVVNSNVLVFKNSRIGIGTQEPEENYRVTISGNTVIRGTLTAEILSYTASNLNHLTIDNLGTQEGINLIQRGYDPFITFRSNESGIVDIIDGKGNVGIGTSIAYESLVVQGKVVAKDLLLTGESIYQKPLQVPPIHQTFIVQDRADLDFMVETNGIYAASNEDVEVYLNGYKLAYFNSNLKDYVVSYSNEYNPPKTYFNITLTSVAKSQDVIDITFWPRTLDQVQGTLGGYSTQSIYSYWDKALDNSVYYSGNVGIGTHKALSKLDVRGRITGTDFYGNGAGLSNVPGAFEKISSRDSVYVIGNIGIGTTLPRQKLDVQGNIFSSGSIVCSNINALGTFTVLNTISSNTDRMVIENMNTSTSLRVLQTGLNFPLAVFEKGSNEPVMVLTPTGKIGIGTNTPLEVLDVRGNLYVSGNIACSNISTIGEFTTITTATNQTEQLIVVNAGTSTAFTVTQNGYTKVAEFFRSNISVFQVANDGNVGIGTNIPIQKLDVQGTIRSSNLQLVGNTVLIQTHPTATLNLQAGQIVVSSDLLPSLCNVYDLGSSNYRFKDLYLSGNTIDLGGTRISKNSTSGGIQIVNQQGNSVDLNSKAIYTSNVGIGTNQTNVSLEIWSSNAVLLPKGTTLERPTGQPGYIRYNSELNSFEGYSLQWGAIGGASSWSSNEKDTYHIYGNVGIGTTVPRNILDVGFQKNLINPYGACNVEYASILKGSEFYNEGSRIAIDSRGILYRSSLIPYSGSPTPLYNLDGSLSACNIPANYTTYLLRYDIHGIITHTTYFNTFIAIQSIQCDLLDNVYISGARYSGSSIVLNNLNSTASSYTLASATSINAFLIKYDKDGFVKGATTIPSNYPSYVRSLAIDSENSIYATGQYLTTGVVSLKDLNGSNSAFTLPVVNALGSYHPLIVKYSSNGDILGRTYVNTGNGINYGIVCDTFNNIYTIGTYGSYSYTLVNFDGTSSSNVSSIYPSSYITVTKYNRFGNVHSYFILPGNGHSIVCDLNNTIYISGNYFGQSTEVPILNFDQTLTGYSLPINETGKIILKYNTQGVYQGHILNKITYVDDNDLLLNRTSPICVDAYNNVYYTFYNDTSNISLSNLDQTLSAYTLQQPIGKDVSMIKYNPNGKIQSVQSLNLNKSFPTDCAMDSMNNFYVAGHLEPIGGYKTIGFSNLDGSSSSKSFTTSETYHDYLIKYSVPTRIQYQDAFVISNGNVGIGTTIPMETLHVIGNSIISGSNQSTYTTTSKLNVNGDVEISNQTLLLGNLGIGTTVPLSKFHTVGITYMDGSLGIGTQPTLPLDVNGNALFRNNLEISNQTVIMGNLGVGTLNPAQKLDVRGNIYSSGTITCSNISIIGDFVTMNTVTSNTEQMVIENTGTGPALKVTQTGVNTLAEFYDKESGVALYIANGGNVGIGTNVTTARLYVAGQIYATENITAFSDANYKTNIQRIPNALEKITNIHGYTYTKLEDPTGKSYMGVLAQEIEPVFPELIEKQGNTLSVAYGNMVAPLIEMIHELKQRVEALEQMVHLRSE